MELHPREGALVLERDSTGRICQSFSLRFPLAILPSYQWIQSVSLLACVQIQSPSELQFFFSSRFARPDQLGPTDRKRPSVG
jgi:hypothetical protein